MMNITEPFTQPLPSRPGQTLTLGNLFGCSKSLMLKALLQAQRCPLMVVTPDLATANQLQHELAFFMADLQLPIQVFPDWETLPYDHFSPHPDIISQRLTILNQLPRLEAGVLLVSMHTLMQRLPPRDYLEQNSFVLKTGQKLSLTNLREQLQKAGYRSVSQVMEHGEYAVRGSLFDVFPMGSDVPFRIDLFDDEIDSLRTFDPETQRTLDIIAEINLLPAHEFPLTPEGVEHFRQAWRTHFSVNPIDCPIYQGVSQQESPPGIEYFLSLFFSQTQTLLDYLPAQTLLVTIDDLYNSATRFWSEVCERYEQLRYDIHRPLLPPLDVFLSVEQLFGHLKQYPKIALQTAAVESTAGTSNLFTEPFPDLAVDHQAPQPLHKLQTFLAESRERRVLFCVDTEGRRQVLESLLYNLKISPKFYPDWQDFLAGTEPVAIILAPLEQGLLLVQPALAIISEAQLFGEQVKQRRWRKKRALDPEHIIRDLTELKIGAPVVHIDHGVGRYLGLQLITTGDYTAEYLTLEYADQAKLYVPISALHLISRYSGGDLEHAPLHRLGSGQWEKVKRKAQEKIRDVAAELLLIYAQRAAKSGFAFSSPEQEYQAFAAAFPFEETPDQQQAITHVLADMQTTRCMDRLVCGDVGFGKTEVAMRAAFLAVQSHQQVAVLVPTTLLAEQHLHSFRNRFAKWPVRIEAFSRFRSQKEQTKIQDGLKNGTIDIVIGTHKLLQPDIQFKSLRLLIVDEEHRFGVRQKERIKALRAEIDLLTLTATPIPRSLNMALGNVRDLSIIATPPSRRLSVKTFVREYNPALIREAILRETLRGGQVYFLHNEVKTIEKIAVELQVLLPEIRLAVAHGQMREQTLERIMSDFYHQRFNVLVATTIIESGIDIPSANTIIINRADKLGLAQLHQLRGRVGRSHHQAYAYLLTPPEDALSSDAKKRLAVIESLEDLGSGFMLATHDLEIRGAGELLGEEQSGHLQEIGFSLYMELLEQTVAALKAGKEPLLEKPQQNHVEMNSKIPALIPEDYMPDVHTRLIFYKRIANAKDHEALQEIQAELVDRFGLLPQPAKNLLQLSGLKWLAQALDVKRIDIGEQSGMIEFHPEPNIQMSVLIQLVQKQSQIYKVAGSEKLSFKLTAETVTEKIAFIEQLLNRLKKNL
ncbi:MAG: transcription-repair coupling factor [Gammaproteobacteria bacterium]